MVQDHPDYTAGKAGDAVAAYNLVRDTLSEEALERMVGTSPAGCAPTLVPVRALERQGVNAIPEVFAHLLSRAVGWPVEPSVVQVNLVSHTGASGFARLARQALFEGDVAHQGEYHSGR